MEELCGAVEGEAGAGPGVAAAVVVAPLGAEVVAVEVAGGEDTRGVVGEEGEAGGRQAQGGQPPEEDGHQADVIIIGWREDRAEAGGASEAGLVAAGQHRLQRVGDRGGRRGG